MPAPDTLDARREPLRFGYSLAELDDIAATAAATAYHRSHLNRQVRTETAWEAITTHLYATDTPPQRHELLRVAWNAIRDAARADCSFRGWHPGYDTVTRPGFERYWALAANPHPSPEPGVVERLALAQIWPALRPRHRRVLLALAAHDDHTRAAEAVGLKYHSFVSALSQARRAFLALWHQHEIPSRPWGHDVRGKHTHGRRTVTGTVLRLRQRQRARRGAPVPHPRHRRKDIGIPDTELARRYQAGETLKAIAETVGLSKTAVRNRIQPHLTGRQPPH
ncbi:hypothetical protein NI17_001810 [Thermobifida halotolerans]|uniref:Uncharacterized protein n=1 Tax=Thermobifida halotolerans TaxID=483545 RepID=A0AA97LXU8_9ACTN|nr:hypothetical protein [Thermobifida halotolerans]UOE20015.1 hypothetical protein NI17_001810 [Thermobifida halotolerans]